MNSDEPSDEPSDEHLSDAVPQEDVAELLSSLSSLRDIECSSEGSSTSASSSDSLDFDSFPAKWADSFVLLEKLESGMTGAYLAEQPQLSGHRYVIKILADTKPDSVKRFEMEANILGRLHKAGITKVPFPVFFGWFEGFPYLVMEYVAGKTLKQLSATEDWQPSLESICRIILDAASTLDAAHRFGVIHRDIKPSNLILGTDGQVRVIDFGVAKDQELDSASAVTATGLAPGTQAYMSPEQLAGKQATPRSDIFSLGLVFQELLDRAKNSKSASGNIAARRLARQMVDRSAERRISSFAEVSQQLQTLSNRSSRSRKNRALILNLLLAGIGACAVWLVARNFRVANPTSEEQSITSRTNAAAHVTEREFVPPPSKPTFPPPPVDDQRWLRMEPRERR